MRASYPIPSLEIQAENSLAAQQRSLALPKLLMVGATRGTGRILLHKALASGYEVTVLVRSPEKLEVAHDKLHLVVGDATVYSDMERAVKGQDIVLSTLGAPAQDRTFVRTRSAENMVCAMEKLGVERLISLTSMGVRSSRKILPWWLKYLVVPLVLRRTFADHTTQELCIEQSALQWTIVQPSSLTDEPATGQYKHGKIARETARELTLTISREDVADFMLAQVHSSAYLRQIPGLSC